MPVARRRPHAVLPPGVAGLEDAAGVYLGQVQDGRRHGRGVLRQPDGTVMRGTWKNGLAHGVMTQKQPDGLVVVQAYSRGVANGHCRLAKPGAVHAEGMVVDGEHYGVWWYWTPDGMQGRYRFDGDRPIEEVPPWGHRARNNPKLAAAGPEVYVPNPHDGDLDLARAVRMAAGGLAKLSGLDLELVDCIVMADDYRHTLRLTGRPDAGRRGGSTKVIGQMLPRYFTDGMPYACWVFVDRGYARLLHDRHARQLVAHVLHHELAHASDLKHKARRIPALFPPPAETPGPGLRRLNLADVAWSEYYAESVTRYSSSTGELEEAIGLFKHATIHAGAFMRPEVAGGFGRHIRPTLDREQSLSRLLYASGELAATLDIAGRTVADLPELVRILRETELTGFWARISAALRHAAKTYADWDATALDDIAVAAMEADTRMVES